MTRHVFYLHGFASSSKSTKAGFLAERLKPFGIELQTPDFNQPDFSMLTCTRMIGDVERAMARGPESLASGGDGDRPEGPSLRGPSLRNSPVALIGSSLGALVAYHAAARNARVDRLILLAPALDIAPSLRRGLGDDKVAQWQRDGSLEVFHHGYNEPRRVRYELFEDCARYDPFTTRLDIPILVFQGRRDASVDPAMVERFASTRPNVMLHMLDDDHQLISSLEHIWQESARFLGLTA